MCVICWRLELGSSLFGLECVYTLWWPGKLDAVSDVGVMVGQELFEKVV